MPARALLVIPGPDNPFALPEFAVLLREELAQASADAARAAVGQVLLLQPCAASRASGFGARHSGIVHLHADRGGLRGDVACDADALPFEDDAFPLVVAQHVGDVLPGGGGFVDELARVLAPGGTLLWYGLSPWSPWLAWIHWQARLGLSVPRVQHADMVRRELLKRGLAAVGSDHLGSCWPTRGEPSRVHRTALLAPLRAAYRIAASKQRAVLTPLRPRRARARVAMQPHLASPSTRARA